MSLNHKLQAYINGNFQLYQDTFLHISDLSIQRGYGVFDFFKVQEGKPVFLKDYLERFYESARLMELTVPLTETELTASIHQLLTINNLPLSGIKMILTGGYSANGYDPAEPNLIIQQQPLQLPTQDMIEKGIKVITHDHVREIPRAKTTNYAMGIRLINKIKQAGASDVLYQKDGVVSELPRCNFFIVTQNDTIVTPSEDVLLGITRKNVLALAGKKYRAEERTITIADISEAKEAFLTSTTKRILPIVQVDDMVIENGRPGTITLGLLQDLIDLEQQL
ncbi:aminotransferase class IV [Pontibacter pudoricolor]|uniref:aminotransferase class IV n=1 Tax=Pontibacter pudoricolor TaxID=2694930 RepID=UPI0013916DF2|nr:aminotransferase class IV [Pontibacter pudoricolor]